MIAALVFAVALVGADVLLTVSSFPRGGFLDAATDDAGAGLLARSGGCHGRRMVVAAAGTGQPDRPAAVRRRRLSRTAARLLLLGHAGGFTVPVGFMDPPLLNLSSSLNMGRLTRESGRVGDDSGRGGHRTGTGEVGVGMVTV